MMLHLGKYVLVPILSEWLRYVDMLRLDSALCNWKLRRTSLTLLQEYPERFARVFATEAVDLSRGCILWQYDRGLLSASYFNVSILRLKDSYDIPTFKPFFTQCCNLLEIHGTEGNFFELDMCDAVEFKYQHFANNSENVCCVQFDTNRRSSIGDRTV